MIPRFSRPASVISRVINKVMDYIFDTHGQLITQWNHNILNPSALQRYALAISQKGAALDNGIGFIDGTVRPISRPGEN